MHRRPFQRFPKDSAYFLIIQSQSPSTEVQHTAFLSLSEQESIRITYEKAYFIYLWFITN